MLPPIFNIHQSFHKCLQYLSAFNHSHQPSPCDFYLKYALPPPKNIKLSAVPCFPILNSSRLSRQESTFSTASRTAKQFSSNLSLPYSISFCLPFSECLQTLKNPFLHRATGYLCSTAMFRNMWIYLWCNQRLL